MVYLYILFELSSMGSVYKWRLPQKDMATCLKNLKETKVKFPKASESTLGVVVTCGGEIERHYGSAWIIDEKKDLN